VWVRADGSAIERTLRILLENAVKYTPGGGEVNVLLGHDGNTAHIEIRDTGIGIPAKDLPHIFERFYRADPARSRETGGSGLGLAIAQWLMEAHRAVIRVQSTVGEGSAFSIRIPLTESPIPVKDLNAVISPHALPST
jgi:signal transduction histidine kinase